MAKKETTKKAKKVLCPMDVINTNKETSDINTMVADYSKVSLGGKLNLNQFKSVKAVAVQHQKVCQTIEEFHTTHPDMPMYAVLSCGISAGAYKRSEFINGYKNFDSEKCETIFEMAKAYNDAMGIKGKPSDVVYRLMLKFYNTQSHDLNVLKERLKTAQQMDGKRGHFKELCANLGM